VVNGVKESEAVWRAPPKDWSPVTRAIAIREAKERRKNPNTVGIGVAKLKLNKRGKLTIKFTNPVRFPSYMIKKEEGRKL